MKNCYPKSIPKLDRTSSPISNDDSLSRASCQRPNVLSASFSFLMSRQLRIYCPYLLRRRWAFRNRCSFATDIWSGTWFARCCLMSCLLITSILCVPQLFTCLRVHELVGNVCMSCPHPTKELRLSKTCGLRFRRALWINFQSLIGVWKLYTCSVVGDQISLFQNLPWLGDEGSWLALEASVIVFKSLHRDVSAPGSRFSAVVLSFFFGPWKMTGDLHPV